MDATPGDLKVLLVEDSPADARLVVELLRDVSAVSVSADHQRSLRDAVDSLDHAHFDAILLDLGLPDGQGLSALARVRDAAPETPVVVLTGNADRELAVAAVHHGAQDYIVKGTGDGDALLNAIRYAIERTKFQGRLRQAADAVSSVATGEQCLNRLLQDLSKVVEMPCVMVCRLASGEVTVLASAVRGEIQSGMVYAMAGSLFAALDPMAGFTHLDDLEKCAAGDAAVARWTLRSVLVVPLPRIGGELHYLVAASTSSRSDDDGNSEFMHIFASRIASELDRRRQEGNLRRLASVIEQSSESVFMTTPDGVIHYVNPAFEQLTGYTREEALGQNASMLRSGRHDDAFYQRMWESIDRGKAFRDVFINRRKSGAMYYEEKTIFPLRDGEGRITDLVSVGLDITEDLEIRRHIDHLLRFDHVTGAVNRMEFSERLDHLLDEARIHGRTVAVMCMDLMRFGAINDALGHDTGDQVLALVVERLRRCIQEADIVGRIGSDDFAIALADAVDAEHITTAARCIMAQLGQPFVVNQRELFVDAGIGISLFPDDGGSAAVLLKNADIARLKAHDEKRAQFCFFAEGMQSVALERLELQSDLHRAIERNEFLLHYQPLRSLADDQVVAVEALLRWRHPQFGLVPPDKFIPLLEERGLIREVGEWVLKTACQDHALLSRHQKGPLRMAVNLSVLQLNDPGFPGRVTSILKETGMSAANLELEITEGMIMTDPLRCIESMNALRQLGVSLSVDDFGMGHSSLGYLKRLPAQTLKIDRVFIQDIPADEQNAVLVELIVDLGHRLGMHVVAEGVETQVQLSFLRNCHCDVVQGYLISRPLARSTLAAFLSAQTE